MDMYGFYTGQAFDAYEYLGAHLVGKDTVFRTFAPNAQSVSLLLNGQELPMQKAYDGNFYELTAPNVPCGEHYEYRVYRRDGGCTDHCDPYGFAMDLRPDHKSILCNLITYTFGDAA